VVRVEATERPIVADLRVVRAVGRAQCADRGLAMSRRRKPRRRAEQAHFDLAALGDDILKNTLKNFLLMLL
jgi:hypothetical protein